MKAWIIEPRYQNCQTVLYLLGHCTADNHADQLSQRLATMHRNEKDVVISLARVSDLDHVAVAELCHTAKRIQSANQKLHLVDVPGRFQELFVDFCAQNLGVDLKFKNLATPKEGA